MFTDFLYTQSSYSVVSFLYYVLEGYYEKDAFFVASDHNVGFPWTTTHPLRVRVGKESSRSLPDPLLLRDEAV